MAEGQEEEEEVAQARAAASAQQKIIKPHFLTSDPRQAELPLGLFDAEPDIFIFLFNIKRPGKWIPHPCK